MTSAERIRTILAGGYADRPATFECIVNDEIIRHFAGEDIDMANPKPVVHKAIAKAVDSTRMDIIYPQPEGERSLPDGTLIKQRRWTGWQEPPYSNLEEAEVYLRKQMKEIEDSDIDIQGLITAYEQTRLDLDDCYLFGNFMAKTGIMIFAGIGLEYFSYLMADKPDLIRAYYEVTIERSVRSIEATEFPESIGAIHDCEDIAYRGGLILPLDYLRKEFIPRLERLVDAWHRKNIKFVYHSDGNLTEILPDLVSCGIDGLNPLETQAGLELSEIRKIAPDVIFIGGMDCSQILPLGSLEEVRTETRRVLRELGPHSIIGSSSELHNAVPLANYLAFLETVQEWQ